MNEKRSVRHNHRNTPSATTFSRHIIDFTHHVFFYIMAYHNTTIPGHISNITHHTLNFLYSSCIKPQLQKPSLCPHPCWLTDTILPRKQRSIMANAKKNKTFPMSMQVFWRPIVTLTSLLISTSGLCWQLILTMCTSSLSVV